MMFPIFIFNASLRAYDLPMFVKPAWVYAKPIPFPIRANKPIPFIGNAHGLIGKALAKRYFPQFVDLQFVRKMSRNNGKRAAAIGRGSDSDVPSDEGPEYNADWLPEARSVFIVPSTGFYISFSECPKGPCTARNWRQKHREGVLVGTKHETPQQRRNRPHPRYPV
jgi:hypothetical protein